MAARRKKVSRKRGASRPPSRGAAAFGWFATGFIAGIAVAGVFLMRDLADRLPDDAPTVQAPDEAPLIVDDADPGGKGSGSKFDFFTVLPEMEVVVPEGELIDDAGPAGAAAESGRSGAYILQAGSFRNADDAEQMKARLALLGTQAEIRAVTVNDSTWHRVRIGPVQGARRADEIRRLLQDNGIDTLVMKDSS